MQIDFGQDLGEPLSLTGFLDKKGSIRKNWKNRYFLLRKGSLSYYAKAPSKSSSIDGQEGIDLKGEISLLGADVIIMDGTYINVMLRGERRPHMQLKAKSNKEANDWYLAIIKHVRYQNTSALQNQSRLPEVIEWYYQLQAELNRKHSFLLKNTEMCLSFPSVSKNENVMSTFNIAMTEDRTGLVLSIISNGKKPGRVESLNNGRILLFTDLLGASLPMGWSLTKESKFPFTLITKEDQFICEMDAMGVTWLNAVRDMVQFAKIVSPSGRSISTFAMDRNVSSLMEFSANSGAVFASSSDVQLILESLHRVSSKSPVILDIGQRINTVLKLIPDMRCNKEAAIIFGERIEEITRVLGDSEVGVLFLSREADKSLLNFHLSTFNGKLNDIIQYLSSQTRKGWLAFNITSRLQDSAKLKFQQYDTDLTNIVNTLIKAMNISQAVLFEKKDYLMAVDVKKSVEALGGIEAIYKDVAKERALAKLIQADGHEVHSELEDFIKTAPISPRISYDSYRTSVDTTSESYRPSWQRFICCCFYGRPLRKPPHKKQTSAVQLRENLLN